jgi:hypothetical protein
MAYINYKYNQIDECSIVKLKIEGKKCTQMKNQPCNWFLEHPKESHQQWKSCPKQPKKSPKQQKSCPNPIKFLPQQK